MNRSTEDWARLGREVRRARKAKGYRDTKKWADAVGRSSRVVLGLERGEPTGEETLELVSAALGEPLDWCLNLLDGGSVRPSDESPAYVGTGSGGRRDLSDYSLEQLAEEQRLIADEMLRRVTERGT